jgi:NADH-ubiquinone oxidoreductase chain 1
LPVTFCHFIALVTAVIFSILANIIYFLLLDRLVLSTVQRRSGPYIVGWFGLIQSIDDGIKLYIKRLVLPMKSHALIFISTPIVLLSTGLWTWSIMPYYQAGDFGYYTELS